MKFLQQIAKIYAEKLTPTAQLLFVFPNRRAGLFFKKELLALTKKAIFAPEITDINSFAATISPLHKANDIELLFDLYESYVEVRSEYTNEIESIDAFVPFGTTLLGDFNEIDKYLIDTRMLFSNIADIKNLNDQSQFLSEQQIEVLNTFWRNVRNEANENLSFNSQFISLWSNLYDIYDNFTKKLIAKGIGYDGLIYRTAIEALETKEYIQYKKHKNICFIGFNSLTTSEYRIFKHFKQIDIADFYFDYPTCYNTPSSFATSVGKYYERNLKEFPSQYEYIQPQENKIPQIIIHSTPSTTNQANIACSIIEKDKLFDNNTAILLADESLMPSLVQQLPKDIEKINITMGYPLSITPITTLVNHILALQTEVTNNKEGKLQFYYKPLLSILSHSNIQALYPTAVNLIINQITKANLIRITEDEIENLINKLQIEYDEKQFFIELFKIQPDTKALIEYLGKIINKFTKTEAKHINDTDLEFLYQYDKVLKQLSLIIEKANITITLTLFKLLINRLTSSLKVQFEGEPVEGMQIMGLLESRLLDFDNIILLGFNDSKIPGSKSVNSIIPYNLRRAYNLPTNEVSDAIQAYNFYRTLYHTKNIHLIYDSRKEGVQSEISRYYYQMQYLLNAEMKQYNYTLPINNTSESKEKTLTINKTREILKKLDSYKLDPSDNNAKSLSASRLKDYITCPLKFYFSTVVGIKTPNKINELEESGLLGDIYHLAMEQYYKDTREPKHLEKEEIEDLVKKAFDIESEKSGKRISISGFNSLIFNIVYKFVSNTIDFDIKRYQKEKFGNVLSEEKFEVKINDVNFIAYIDRIDTSNEKTNIIDYKTTSSKTKETINILDLVTSYESGYHEIFQILFYCYLYKTQFGSTPIMPTLYKTNSLKGQNGKLTKIKLLIPNELSDCANMPSLDIELKDINTEKNNCTEVEIEDYKQISCEFEWLVKKILHDIYNPNKPFVQTPNATIDNACQYCPYTTICGK